MKKGPNILNFKYCKKLFITVGLITLIGIGCGGGEDNGGESVDTPISPLVKEGIFLDSAVEGIAYSSATQSGLTDSQGTFKFQEGESITFAIGNITLGQAVAKSVITPIDLVEGAVDPDNSKVINICRFLLTLDNDSDPNNGIFIPEVARNAVIGSSINFDVSGTEFEDFNIVRTFIHGVSGDPNLVTSAYAQNHLNNTLLNIYPNFLLSGEYILVNYYHGDYDPRACYSTISFDGNGNATYQELFASDGEPGNQIGCTYNVNANGTMTTTLPNNEVIRGIVSADSGAIAIVNTDLGDGNIGLDIAIKKSSNMGNNSLSGEYILVNYYHGDYDPRACYSTISFDGNGNATYQELFASDGEPGNQIGCTYNINADGTMTTTLPNNEVIRGIVSADSSVIAIVNTDLGDGNIGLDIAIKKK